MELVLGLGLCRVPPVSSMGLPAPPERHRAVVAFMTRVGSADRWSVA